MEERRSKTRDMVTANTSGLLYALLIVAIAIFMIIVIYGVDTVIPGMHDIFHDFRHTTGFFCH